MKFFTMEVVCQTLTIKAETEAEAEAKYDAFFTFGESCPCGEDDCDCVTEDEDCYHITTEDKESRHDTCSKCEEVCYKDMGKYSIDDEHRFTFTCLDCLESSSQDPIGGKS